MKALLVTILFTAVAVTDMPELVDIRVLLAEGVEDKDKSEEYWTYFESITEDDEPIYQGFKGMGLMLQAKHAWNPYNKLKRFGEGRAWLENAIALEPDNIELHHMRFCIQTNAPFFLNYHDEIEEDRDHMINAITTVSDEDLKERIINYLIESGECSDEDVQLLNDARKSHTGRLGR